MCIEYSNVETKSLALKTNERKLNKILKMQMNKLNKYSYLVNYLFHFIHRRQN